MILVKLGILFFLGKGYYLPFMYAHLIQHTTHVIKHKMLYKEEKTCSPQHQ